MTRRGSLKISIVILIFLLVAGTATAVKAADKTVPFAPKGQIGQPAYKADEIIVKFKDQTADTLAEELSKGQALRKVKLSNSLDNLGIKYKVKKIEPVIKNFKAKRKNISALLAKDTKALTKREKQMLRRLERRPKGAEVPDLDRIYTIKLENGQSATEAVAEYNKDPDVEYAELNYIYSIFTVEPNDPNYDPEQWALNNYGQYYPIHGANITAGTAGCDVNAPEAWAIHTGSSDIIVAVVDTGVDYNHRDLQGNMWTDTNGCYGYDFFNNDNYPMDDEGHGTHCAGIIAARGNNGLDITGLSWNAKIMAVKWMDSGGFGHQVDAFRAIYYATDNGADIISNSWGGFPYSQAMEEVFNYAHSQGVIVVAASGNFNYPDSVPYIVYPANCDHVISVTATDSNDERAWFANYGSWVNLAAPGVSVLSLHAAGTDGYGNGQFFYPHGDPNASMYFGSGTSMACPHVAGACALLLSLNPFLKSEDINDILMGTVDKIFDPNDEICKSNGRLNVHRALLSAVNSKGYVLFDRYYYMCVDTIGISAADGDLAGQDTQAVNVITDGGDSETVTLTQIEPYIGVFKGTICTSAGEPNIGDGILQVSHNENINVIYEDVNDGTGNAACPNDIATIDCEGPQIYNIDIDAIGPEPTITFNTDEAARVTMSAGESCEEVNEIVVSPARWTTSHTIQLSGVRAWTEYHFIIEAVDAAGNKTVDNNDMNCYQFTTDGPTDMVVRGDYNSIQEAINRAWDGGTVTVSSGIYYESINFKGKAITVRGSNPDDWDVVEETIIDAAGEHYGIVFEAGEDANSVLEGVTVRIGTLDIAVYCINSSSPTINKCIIADCGIGVTCEPSCSTIIKNNVIRGNTLCGICYVRASPIMKDNLIYNNGDYGLLVEDGNLPGVICNNTIVGHEYGIAALGTSPIISNCIIWGNVDDLMDCNAIYSCIEDGDAGIGNISIDPCFVDEANGDYHLRSAGWRWDRQRKMWTWDEMTSPCIDKGNPGSPLGEELLSVPDDPNNKWGENLRINMGAYGGTAEASMAPLDWILLADLNNDEIVNFLDFAGQVQDWLMAEDEQPGDLNRDGVVNRIDLAILIEGWLRSKQLW